MAERVSTPSGAPAREGGVTTFAFQVGNPTSLARPVSQGAPVRGGVQGGAAPAVPQADHRGVAVASAQASQDLDVLMKFGQRVLGERMQKAQDAAYWEGVKKAAVGSSMQDIIAEEPWYAKIFGDTPMIQGARAYTAQAKLDTALSQLAQEMPELRKKGPNDVAAIFTGTLDGMMTGDPLTDAVLKRSASEKLPLLMKQHASEHYGYLQSEVKRTQFDSWNPVAATLQAQGQGVANGTVSPADFAVAQQQALGAIAPLDGQNDESYRANMLSYYNKAAQDGNFHMVGLLDKAGVRSFFTPDQQRTLDDTIFRYSQRAKSKYVAENMAEDLAALKAAAQTGQVDPKETAEKARFMNARFKAATGIDEDVINVETLTTTSAVELFQDQKRIMTKQQEMEAKLANTRIGFSAGYGLSSYADTGLSRTQADTAFREVYNNSKDQVKLMIDNATLAPEPYVSASLAGEIRATVQGSAQDQWNPGMENVYNSWKKIAERKNGGEATASAYFGTYHAQFKAMDTLITRGTPQDVAYNQVFNTPFAPSPALTKANSKALEEGIKSINQYDGWKGLFTWAGARPLSDAAVRGVTSILAPKFDQYMQLNPSADPTEASKVIAQSALAAGEMEMYGEYAWNKDPNQVPLSKYVGPVREWAAESVESTIATKLKAQGATSVQDYTIFRGPDANGDPVIYVQALGDGNVWNVVVRGSEIKALYDATRDKKAKPTPPAWGEAYMPLNQRR